MSAPARLAVFGAGLLAAFALGAGIGGAVGPIDTPHDEPMHEQPHDVTPTTHGNGHEG